MQQHSTGSGPSTAIADAGFARRLMLYLAEMGPAFLVTAMFVGGATVITTSTLGSVTAYTYLWAVILAMAFFWVWNLTIMTLTLVSGKHYVQLLRDNLHPAAYWVAMVSILLVNTIFHTTQVFLSALVLRTFFGGPLLLWVFATAALILAVIFGGRGAASVRRFQQLGQGVVWIMLATFIICLFLADVDWGAVASGIFVPTIPVSQQHILLVAAVVGSSLTVQSAPLLSASAVQRGWGPDRLPLGRLEVAIGAIIFMLVNLVLVILFASTFGATGEAPQSPIAAALALTPLIGSFGTYVFALGLWFAVISTIATQVVLHGQMLTDVFRTPIDFESTRFKTISVTLLAFGLLLPLVGLTPFQYVIYAAAFNVSFMPLLLLFSLLLIGRGDVMGSYKVSWVIKVLLVLALAFTAWNALQFWLSR